MSRKRSHLEPKSRWKSKSAGAASHWTLLGEAPLLPGEDRAAYEQLRNQLCAVIKPVDIIDKILIADVRVLGVGAVAIAPLKSSVVQARAMKALEQFLFFVLESRNQSLGNICRTANRHSSDQPSTGTGGQSIHVGEQVCPE